MTVLPNAVALPQWPTLLFLLVVSVGTVLTGSLYMARVRDALVRAEQRIHLQAWQLAQLVPDTAHGATEVELATPPGCPIAQR